MYWRKKVDFWTLVATSSRSRPVALSVSPPICKRKEEEDGEGRYATVEEAADVRKGGRAGMTRGKGSKRGLLTLLSMAMASAVILGFFAVSTARE
jgi:hypothetical protein